MSEDMVNKNVFIWSKLNGSPWAKDIFALFEEVGLQYSNNLTCSIASISEKLIALFETKRCNYILLEPKLRTYIQIKHNFGPEPYGKANLTKKSKGPSWHS